MKRRDGQRVISLLPIFAPVQLRDDILRRAIIGTSRSPAKTSAAGLDLPETASPAKNLLSLAAAEARARRAGHLFLKKEALEPLVLEEESLAPCPPAAARMLRQILGGSHMPALPEFLRLAVLHKKALPPACLPTIIFLFFEKKLDWPSLHPALGERGRWLAAQHPDWKNLLFQNEPTTADFWEGKLPERLLFLKKLRSENPDEARALLQKTWGEEPWEHRAQFVAALETGLSAADEPFLEAAISDKRKEVRRQAIRLAGRVEGGRFAAQLFRLAADSVVFEKKTGKIEAFLNRDSPNAAILQVLESSAAPKIAALDHAVLMEILAAVRPENWEVHFAEGPEKLVRLFDEAGIVLPVMEAARSFSSQNWLAALLDFWAKEPGRPAWNSPVWAEVLAELPPEVFDRKIGQAFSDRHFLLENNSPLLVALVCTGHFWSERFTVALFRHVHFWLGHQSELAWNAFYLHDFFQKTIWRAEPRAVGELRETWHTPPRYSPISPLAMEQIWGVLDFRNRLRAAF